MKKSFLLVLFMQMLASPCFSEPTSQFWSEVSKKDPANLMNSENAQGKISDVINQSEITEGEKEQSIYQNYGSTESPAFLNRIEENPNEANYAFGSSFAVPDYED